MRSLAPCDELDELENSFLVETPQVIGEPSAVQNRRHRRCDCRCSGSVLDDDAPRSRASEPCLPIAVGWTCLRESRIAHNDRFALYGLASDSVILRDTMVATESPDSSGRPKLESDATIAAGERQVVRVACAVRRPASRAFDEGDAAGHVRATAQTRIALSKVHVPFRSIPSHEVQARNRIVAG